jgi:hypothetical protein
LNQLHFIAYWFTYFGLDGFHYLPIQEVYTWYGPETRNVHSTGFRTIVPGRWVDNSGYLSLTRKKQIGLQAGTGVRVNVAKY